MGLFLQFTPIHQKILVLGVSKTAQVSNLADGKMSVLTQIELLTNKEKALLF